jgi:FkbM family methyltransferase
VRIQEDICASIASAGGRVLDIGCADGLLIERLQARGLRCQGIDPSVEAATLAREDGLDVVQGYFPHPEIQGPFDVVSVSHVLEHVPNPSKFLQDLQTVAPGGRVVFTQASYLGIIPRTFKHWYAWCLEGHFWHFTAKSLRWLLTDSGFEVESVRQSSLTHESRRHKYFLNTIDLFPGLSDQYVMVARIPGVSRHSAKGGAGVESNGTMGVLHTLQASLNLLRASYENLSVYRSWVDAAKALTLRAALGRGGGRLFKPRLMQIHARGYPTPIYLRRKTSDFQIFSGLFELATYDVAKQLDLGESPWILDCGGNIGLASLRFSLLFPNAKILVVEPDEGNLAVLRMNLSQLIDDRRCTVVPGFAGAADGVASIDRSGAASEYRMADTGVTTATEQITVHSIPKLLQMMNATRLDLLKVDIEGAEAKLFADCGSWIGIVRNLLVEVDPPYTVEALMNDLRRGGVNPTLIHQRGAEVALKLSPGLER